MRTFRRFKKSLGFTLVELMIVVAIIGVLAALAIYGVRRYLASAKTSEAKNTLGSIARSAQGAFEREQNASEILTGGGTGAQLSHDLCASSNPSPGNIPAGNKLMPNAGDFETTAAGNSANVGWQCLKFSLSTPVYYQYGYVAQRLNTALPSGESEGSAAIPTSLTDPGTGAFIGYAQGDLDNDGTPSAFGIQGVVETGSKTVSIATQVQIVDEYE